MISRIMPSRVPPLRFPSYKDNWHPYKLDFAATKIQDGTHFSPKVLEVGNYRYITSKNIRNGHMRLVDTQFLSDDEHRNIYKRCDVKYGDVLITKDGASTGNVCINDIREEISLLSSVAFIRANEDVSTNEYIYQYLTTPFGQKEVQSVISGQAITRITLTKLRNFEFWFPSLPEQNKIAVFLSAVDQKIQLLQRKKELLEQYKKGVMQKLFSQEIRFKDDQGQDYPDWEEKRLGEFTYKVGKKNKENISYPIYSINNQEGFLPQSEQFEGMDSADRGYDISMYKIIHNNTFAYNPARINVGSIGYSDNLDGVIISSLYVCFKTTADLDDGYLLKYLDTYAFNKAVLRNAEGGVRQYLFYENFSIIKIPTPSIDEQIRISQFLSTLDRKIDFMKSQIDHIKSFKKGLLQQMFV